MSIIDDLATSPASVSRAERSQTDALAPVSHAETMMGRNEVTDNQALQDYLQTGGQNLDPATKAWCAAFVNASLAKSGGEGTGSLAARSFMNWGEGVESPQRGDVAVFSRGDPNGWQGHVGFFDSFNEDGTINVIGGNQSDGVSLQKYDPSRLLGFRRDSSFAGGDYEVAQVLSPEDAQGVYDMYKSGQFSDDEAAEYEAAVKAGTVTVPDGAVFEAFRETLPADLYDAYLGGNLPDDLQADIQAAIDAGEVSAPNVEAQRTIPQELVRQVGLTGRHIVEGVTNTAAVFTDPIAGVMNMALPDNMQIESMRAPVERGLEALNVPEPENALEEAAGAVSRGMVGAGPGIGLGRAAGSALLSGQPLAQTLSGGAAEGAARIVSDLGAGPLSQLAVAILAGGGAGALAAGRNAAGEVVQQVDARDEAEKVVSLIRKATSRAPGAGKAKKELAEMARGNPEAIGEAQRLGIDLPPDVLTDNKRIQEAAGLSRSIAGSEASVAWRDVVETAAAKADDAMEAIGGTRDLSTLSDTIDTSLRTTRDGMAKEAAKIYAEVNKSITPSSKISTPNLQGVLRDTITNVGVDGLSPAEKKLRKMLDQEGGTTYGRLMREKTLIGQAIARRESPYTGMAEADLKRLYAALSEDQMSVAQSVGGDALASQLSAANAITSKQKDLEKTIINAFGKDGQGSVAQSLITAATKASKGDVSNLRRIMEVVPKELQREAFASAIAAASKSKRATDGGFGFAEFTKLYAGLRENGAAYAVVGKALGPQGHQVLTDLYGVSKRITNARAQVLTTGKANQALVQGITAEKLVDRFLQSSVARAGATGVGAAAGGPAGAAGAHALTAALSGGKKDMLEATGALFKSEAFRKLVEGVALGKQTGQSAKVLSKSKPFQDWLRATNGFRDAETGLNWLQSTIAFAREQE